MKTITLLNEKGGVGKTTLATHIAAGLAIFGYRVMLVDTDAQGNATLAFGLPREPGFYDLIVRGARLAEVLRIVPPERLLVPDEAGSLTGRLYLIPSNVESRNVANAISDAFVIMKRFQEFRDEIDFVVFDTSPTPSLLHSSIYMATDAVVYPTKCDPWAMDGLRNSLAHKESFEPYRKQFGLPPIEVLGIVPTMFRATTLEHTENLSKLRLAFPGTVWEPMSLRTMWPESTGAKRTIWAFAPQSKAAREMWRIISRVEAAYVS